MVRCPEHAKWHLLNEKFSHLLQQSQLEPLVVNGIYLYCCGDQGLSQDQGPIVLGTITHTFPPQRSDNMIDVQVKEVHVMGGCPSSGLVQNSHPVPWDRGPSYGRWGGRNFSNTFISDNHLNQQRALLSANTQPRHSPSSVPQSLIRAPSFLELWLILT